MKIILVKRKHNETTQLISSSGSIDHPLTASGEHIGRFKLSTAKVAVKWRRKSVFGYLTVNDQNWKILPQS